MKYLKKYLKYKESIVIDMAYQNMYELLESMTIWHDALLSSISAEEVNIFETFQLPTDQFSKNLDLDYLDDNVEFINALSSIALKKSEVQFSDDYQTFLNKPCKFMFVYSVDKNELENPEYLLFQSWQDTLSKWDDVRLYLVKDNVNKFYDTLNSKSIEIINNDDRYIYKTTNGANEWTLQNVDKETDMYKKTFRNDEFEIFISDQNLKINIL